MPRDDELLCLDEVLTILGTPQKPLSRSTFYEWRAKKRAPRCIKFPNGDIRIRRGELNRWLNSREEAA